MHHLRLFTASLALTACATAQGFGAVYSLTNDTAANAVAVTLRLPNGQLVPFAEFATRGTGSGAGLGSQGALAASADGGTLLATNAGSNQLTLFRAWGGLLLWRRDTVDTGGMRPTSVTLHDDLAYVLNAGSDAVQGFRVHGGRLTPIHGANYGLSGLGVAAAQVGFSPDGRWLIVTERATNRVDVFPVRNNGTLGSGQFHTGAGITPFGFTFRDDGVLVVSEAAGGAAGASTTSAYRIQANGGLHTISAAVPTLQTAACWTAVTPNGRFAYTANAAGGTITGYAMNPAGAIARLDPAGVSGNLGPTARPLDCAFDASGRFFYVIDSGGDRLQGFRRRGDGSLELLGSSVALPDGSAGLLAR